jgi:hypothetical protein
LQFDAAEFAGKILEPKEGHVPSLHRRSTSILAATLGDV